MSIPRKFCLELKVSTIGSGPILWLLDVLSEVIKNEPSVEVHVIKQYTEQVEHGSC
jgi:hypothetical protein